MTTNPNEIEAAVATIIQDVSELPDRDSPDDQPDMMLVTAEELRLIVERNLEGFAASARGVADGWLIERAGKWWAPIYGRWEVQNAVDPTLQQENWTKDASKAVRFVRKEDAEAEISYHGWQSASATEHVWISGTAAPSSPAATPEVERADDMLRTARELRDNADADCNAIEQAIYWEEKAAALRTPPAPAGEGKEAVRLEAAKAPGIACPNCAAAIVDGCDLCGGSGRILELSAPRSSFTTGFIAGRDAAAGVAEHLADSDYNITRIIGREIATAIRAIEAPGEGSK